MEKINGVLQRRRIARVVFRGDHHDRVRGVHGRAPRATVVLGVLAQARMIGLVEQRQIQLCQIGDLEIEPAMDDRALNEPVGDRPADPPRAGTTDDNQESWHLRKTGQPDSAARSY